jgi:hypothetical protein
MRLGVRREIAKQVTCPACGDIVATAAYRPLSGNLVLTAPDGRRLDPTPGPVLMRQLEQWESMQDRVAWVQCNLEERIFDLRCRRGHSTLATMPRLARTIRSTPGRWIPAAG